MISSNYIANQCTSLTNSLCNIRQVLGLPITYVPSARSLYFDIILQRFPCCATEKEFNQVEGNKVFALEWLNNDTGLFNIFYILNYLIQSRSLMIQFDCIDSL